jgi:hypothetical protein
MGVGNVRAVLLVVASAAIGVLWDQSQSGLDFPVPIFVLCAFAVLLLLQLRATWRLHQEYIKVQKRERKRGPLALKSRSGEAMTSKEAFGRLNAVSVQPKRGQNVPPRIKGAIVLQIVALAAVIAVLYLLVRYGQH